MQGVPAGEQQGPACQRLEADGALWTLGHLIFLF